MKKSLRTLFVCGLAFIAALCFTQNVDAASKKPRSMTISASKSVIDVKTTCRVRVKSVKPAKASKAVTYKSSNSKIATVSSKGVVTGKKSGTVKITVQSKVNKKLKASVKVTVKRMRPYYLKSDADEMYLCLDGKEKISAKVKPKCDLVWSSSNPKVATVDQKGNIYPKQAGKTKIIVKTVKNGYNGKPLVEVCDLTIKNLVNNVYCYLYEDGELVIAQKEFQPDANRKVLESGKVARPSELKNKEDIITVAFKEKVRPVSGYEWFSGCENLKGLKNLQNFDVSGSADLEGMFEGCSSLETLDASQMKDTESTSVARMFKDCTSLKTVNLSSLHERELYYTSEMFSGCANLEEIDISKINLSWIKESGVLEDMFEGCTSLKTVKTNRVAKNKICKDKGSRSENVKKWILVD